MAVPVHPLKISAAGLTLLAMLGSGFFNTGVMAMDQETIVAQLTGPAPQSAPIPHLPSRFLSEGDVVTVGEDYLMLPGSTVVLADLATGDYFTVRGPNRFSIEAGGPRAHGEAGLIRHGRAFFTGPKAAVPLISRHLIEENWLELARYYDLAGTDISPVSLLSGAFFKRETPPEIGHPGGFDKFKQPFSPSFSYSSHRSVGEHEVRVTVSIEIDQGGGMLQQGRDTFTLRKSEPGYRLLPKGQETGEEALPVTVE